MSSFTEAQQTYAEALRLTRLDELNANPAPRADLEAQYGEVWDPTELASDFTVEGFMAPFVVARRKADGVLGTLEFQHSPRLYFGTN